VYTRKIKVLRPLEVAATGDSSHLNPNANNG
jgi:hypothetical protein